MHPDVPTLMVAGSFVSLLSGCMLGFASYHYGETRPGIWWGTANVVLAAALVCLVAGSISGVGAIFTSGLALLSVSAALSWGGARALNGRLAPFLPLIAGPLVLACAHFVPAIRSSTLLESLVVNSVTITYYGSAAAELWRGRSDGIRSRVPLAVLLVVHVVTLVVAVPVPLAFGANHPDMMNVLASLIHFETPLFVMGTSIFVFAMMKERNEARLIEDSNTDPLTGLLNRRGFFSAAAVTLDDCLARGRPAAAIIFDLDHFKLINDTRGHAAGDEVLRAFAYASRRYLKGDCVVGRIGGEEFAVLLAGADVEAACSIADRVRRGFAEIEHAGADTGVSTTTVSAGVSARERPDNIYTLLSEADAGLYLAKSQGRNRVRRGGAREADEDARKVIRVA